MSACSVKNQRYLNFGRNRTVLFKDYAKSKKHSTRGRRKSHRDRKRKIRDVGKTRHRRGKSKKHHSRKHHRETARAIKERPLIMALSVGNDSKDNEVRKHIPVTKHLSEAIDKAKKSSIPDLEEHHKSSFKMAQLLTKLTTLEEQNSVAQTHYDELNKILESNGVKMKKT